MSEMVDVVNESGMVVGTMSREESETLNHLIQNVIVFIFNSKGEVWIQKRPTTKKHFPGLWDVSACGAIFSGEAPDTAAERETVEETGIKLALSHAETFLNIFPGHDGQTFRRLSHLYIGLSNEKPKENVEVDEFKAVPYKQLEKEVTKNPSQYVSSLLIELQKAVLAYKRMRRGK
jgi:isopentenyl-diphosphate delta-isomerase